MQLIDRLWLGALEDLARRGASVEAADLTVHPHGPLAWHRAMVLAVSEGELTIERPRSAVLEHSLKPGHLVRILMSDTASRWQFEQVIAREGRVQLNERTRLPSLTMPLPQHVENAQRRNDYRASARTLRDRRIELRSVPDGSDHTQLFCGEGVIDNLSGGGVGVVVGRSLGRRLIRLRRVACSFEAELLGRTITFNAQLRHWRRDRRGNMYLGLMLVDDGDPQQLAAGESLRHLGAAIQRISLREHARRHSHRL